jgi:hypothetical protein
MKFLAVSNEMQPNLEKQIRFNLSKDAGEIAYNELDNENY